MSLGELTELMASFGQKPYRARQVFEALYKGRVRSVEDITTLSQELRDRLMAEGWSVGLPEMVQTATSVDGTERYLMRMADGETVETVWMPDGDGGERGDGSEAAEEEAGEVVGAEEAVEGSAVAALNVRGGPGEQQVRPSGDDNQISQGNTTGTINGEGGYWGRRGSGRPRSEFGALAGAW